MAAPAWKRKGAKADEEGTEVMGFSGCCRRSRGRRGTDNRMSGRKRTLGGGKSNVTSPPTELKQHGPSKRGSLPALGQPTSPEKNLWGGNGPFRRSRQGAELSSEARRGKRGPGEAAPAPAEAYARIRLPGLATCVADLRQAGRPIAAGSRLPGRSWESNRR
jgi:hypothetical protein